MDKRLFGIILTAMLLGWFSHSAFSSVSFELPYGWAAPERNSPANHLSEDKIQVYKDFAVIRAPELMWATFANTNSMDPVLDADTHALEVPPRTPEDIHVGDIVSYALDGEIIVHRVIRIGSDDEGWYAILKGDNNPAPDPEKMRFSQIHGIVVGIIY